METLHEITVLLDCGWFLRNSSHRFDRYASLLGLKRMARNDAMAQEKQRSDNTTSSFSLFGEDKFSLTDLVFKCGHCHKCGSTTRPALSQCSSNQHDLLKS